MRKSRDERDRDSEQGAMWREFGLRNALAHMPADSPGRGVIEALLARGTLTADEGRRFKVEGLRTALSNMPSDAPGRTVIQALLAREAGEPTAPAAGLKHAGDSPETARGAGGDLPDQLERLVRLRERGYLTDAEFEAAKSKLLRST